MQRRTLSVLMAGQALGVAAIASAVAVVPLLASDLLGSDRWAGLPSAMMTFGTAAVAGPLAQRAARRGRRPALSLGFTIGAGGAVLAFVSGESGVFAGLLIGMLVFGAGQSSTLQTRFAATDLAEPGQYGAAIALVVWVGALGGVIGPVLTPLQEKAGEAIGLAPHVAPFAVAAVLYGCAGAYLAWRLRPDPLVAAGGVDPRAVRGSRVADLRSTIGAIMARPNAALGLATIVLSQAAMVAVMTMTPLHMRDHGHAGLSGYVIGLHIAGMYGAAPLVGRYSDRVGRMRSIQIGGAILASGTMAAVVAGYQPVLIFVGLFLLGLGWNFGLIAGSALLNESVPEGIRVKAQGAADVMLSVFGATAAISSGLIKQGAGFHWLANLATGMAVFVLLWALSASRRQAVTTEPV